MFNKIICVAAAFAAISTGEVPLSPPDNVTISDLRPLNKVAEELIARYGARVSYEDVSAYNYAGDLDKSTNLPRSSGLSISFAGLPRPKYDETWKAQQSADPSRVKTLLQAILNQHERNGNPGRFKIVDTENGMVIVPTATRDSTGTFVPDQSVLDQRISFPEVSSTSIGVLLTAFCKALSAATGKHVYTHVGFGNTQARIGANNEVARDALARMLNTQQWNGMGITINFIGKPANETTWVLMTKPDGYELDIRQVNVEFTWASGHITGVPISLPKP
jgi:hypothetical protein